MGTSSTRSSSPISGATSQADAFGPFGLRRASRRAAIKGWVGTPAEGATATGAEARGVSTAQQGSDEGAGAARWFDGREHAKIAGTTPHSRILPMLPTIAYPPRSVFKQSIYSAFADFKRKVHGGAELIDAVRPVLGKAGFVPARNELKLLLDVAMPQQRVDEVIKILADLGAGVRTQGLADSAEGE
jgi:hypothetical protein